MAIDFSKMKQKLADLESKGSSSNFWRPQDGTQDIRILPAENGDPFPVFFFHYTVTKGGFLCPKKNYGDDCPVCEFASSLYREGTEDSVKLAKDLFAKQRFFSAVAVRGEEEKGAQAWGYGKRVYEELIHLVLNRDYGDVTDSESGTDLTIIYGKPPSARFPETKINPRRKPSVLSENSEVVKSLLDSRPDFSKLFERKSTSDVDRLLKEYLADDSSTDSSEGTVKYGANSSKTQNFEGALDELLNDD